MRPQSLVTALQVERNDNFAEVENNSSDQRGESLRRDSVLSVYVRVGRQVDLVDHTKHGGVDGV